MDFIWLFLGVGGGSRVAAFVALAGSAARTGVSTPAASSLRRRASTWGWSTDACVVGEGSGWSRTGVLMKVCSRGCGLGDRCRWSQQRHAAVDAQVDAGDEAACVRSEEQRGVAELVRFAQSPQRNRFGDVLLQKRTAFRRQAELVED